MKAAILLVSSHSTFVLLGADQQYWGIMDILLTGIFIRVFCLNFFIYNLPATITIETSLHEIFSLRSFEICEWKEFSITDAFFRAHWYQLLCCKASVTPAQLEYLDRQTGQEFHRQSALVQAFLLLKHQPTGQLKERDLWRHTQSANRVSSRSWSRVFTDQSRSLSRDLPNKKVGSTFFALTSTVIPVF